MTRELSLKHIIRVKHASVKLSMAHFAVLTLFKMNDALIFLKVIGLVADVHPFQAIVTLALEFKALLILDLQERVFASSR